MATSRFSDLDRPPLNERALQNALMAPGEFVAALRVLPEVESTNTALFDAAVEGAPHGSVLVAEAQTAGRGRGGRAWTAPARSGLFLSILLRPQVPAARWGWLPLLTGVAARSVIARVAELEVSLKWPNDLVVELPDESPQSPDAAGYGAGRKLGGILAERVSGSSPAVVIGLGLNVTLRETELPAPHATSIALAGGAVTDRDSLLRAVLREFGTEYERWVLAAGDPRVSGLRVAYEAACATLGREVRAELPGGETVCGRALEIDEEGRLVIRSTGKGDVSIGAGDIVHLR
jgi:BirA family transcriptional regulator, biotin operon repressor / biotin---[acetyl-CoA-carboxylase] ligase